MSRRSLVLFSLLFTALFALGLPIEHKYDKLFRFFSLTLIPEGVALPSWFDPKIYFYISDIAALALTFCSFALLRLPLSRFFFDKGAIFLWIIFISALFSIIASPLSSYPIPYVRLLQLLTPILLYSFWSHNFSLEETRRMAKIFIACLFAAACFEAIVAIAQYVNQAPLGLRVLGEVPLASYFQQNSTNRWSLDYLFPHSTEPTLILRASGTLPHSNVLGGFLCASLLSSYFLILQARRKGFLSLLFMLQFFAMGLTFSRSALFSWILGTFVWLLLQISHQGLKILKTPPFRWLIGTIILSMALTTSLLYEQAFNRGGIFNYNQLAQNSDQTRLRYQEIALRMIKAKPWTGVGYSEMGLRTPEYLISHERTENSLSGVHNIYLFLAAETGLISLAAFFAFIVFLLKRALCTPFTHEMSSFIAAFSALLFIGVCDFYPVLFQQGRLLFFSFAAFLSAQSTYNVREYARAIPQ